MYYIGTVDTNPLSKLNAKITNTKLSLTSEQKEFAEVGTV